MTGFAELSQSWVGLNLFGFELNFILFGFVFFGSSHGDPGSGF